MANKINDLLELDLAALVQELRASKQEALNLPQASSTKQANFVKFAGTSPDSTCSFVSAKLLPRAEQGSKGNYDCRNCRRT
jgi:hypothetical protein